MTTHYAEHPAMFRNHPIGFLIALALIPVYGLGLLILLPWYLHCMAAKLSVSDHEILYERGLLSKERIEIGIGSVRTLIVTQSFFNRLFGVGTVKVYTAGDSPEIVAPGMPRPNRVRELMKI